MDNTKKGFTLAEILIVLVVIGVLAGILMPVAFHAAPDENAMKFKKSHSALSSIIRELASSDKYYLDGNLGINSSGMKIEDSTYFCKSLANTMNIKKENCSKSQSASEKGEYEYQDNCDNEYGYLDELCKKNQHEEIIASDGVTYFEADKNYLFSNDWLQYQSERGFSDIYKVICFDVDGINKGEDPFGYGVSADGKILAGKRANVWQNKKVQKGEDTIVMATPYGTKCGSKNKKCLFDDIWDSKQNKCVENWCKGEAFMRIGNLCWTRRNMGDHSLLPIPATITTVSAGYNCDANTTNCCWQGATANGNCNASNGSYSGCNRTVCNWKAGITICDSYTYKGKTWSLPTRDQLARLNTGNNNGLQDKGLMLCANFNPSLAVTNCDTANSCNGATDKGCWADSIWGEEYSATHANYRDMDNDYLDTSQVYPKTYAFSVRCVTELN